MYYGLRGFPPILEVVNLTHWGLAHFISSIFIWLSGLFDSPKCNCLGYDLSMSKLERFHWSLSDCTYLDPWSLGEAPENFRYNI